MFCRWGRVGYRGQTNFSKCGLEEAKSKFSKKFQEKTQNRWEERDQFAKVAGKYDLVRMDYSNSNTANTTDEVDTKPKSSTAVKDEPVESKLPSSVQDLISLICNIQVMEETVMEMEYDTKKSPLGMITVEQICAGYNALKKISECVERGETISEKNA